MGTGDRLNHGQPQAAAAALGIAAAERLEDLARHPFGHAGTAILHHQVTDPVRADGRDAQRPRRRVVSRIFQQGQQRLTDADGVATFPAGLTRGTGAAQPALVTARLGDDMAFLSLTDPAFDLSDRGVAGRAPAGPSDVFATPERGAYRSGETIHLTALMRDARAAAVEGVPLTAILYRPDGVEYSRIASLDDVAGGHVFALPVAANAPRGTWRIELKADVDAGLVA